MIDFVNGMPNVSKIDSRLRKSLGVLVVVIGLLLHLIPLFPASWIIVIGLELLGLRMILWDRLKRWLGIKEYVKEREQSDMNL
ncbi:MAG: hypothetical protein WCL23_04065 [Candidatus Moraniibacteriota bacterium]